MKPAQLHSSITTLVSLDTTLHDDLDHSVIQTAVDQLDQLPQNLTASEVAALFQLLPDNGDTAFGLNWTILHAIEAQPLWPAWELLDNEQNEWHRILTRRLANARITRPT